MKTHDTYLALAAAALDFELSAAERRALDAHLAECPVCVRSASALRADALVLAGLPAITLPERRAAELLYQAMHPARVRHPLRLVAVAALLALLALGSLVVGAEILRRMDDDRLVVLPPATATPAPDTSAEPGATAPVDLAATPWVRLGEVPGGQFEIVGFDGGYVAMGQQTLSFSPDGRAWQAIPLPPLGIEGAREPYVTALASSGAQVLAVGSYGHEPCRTVSDQGSGFPCVLAPIAWVTDDGITWRRSDPWVLPPGVAEVEGGADASAAWAVPGGWEASRVAWDGAAASPVDVWRSADGITWERLAALESAGTNVGHGVAVAADGTRVRWDTPMSCPAEGMCEWTGMLRSSPDGIEWTVLDTFPGAGVSILGVAPPSPGQRSVWVVTGTEVRFDDTGGILSAVPRLWTSGDLSGWTAIDVSVPSGTRAGMAGLAWTADRVVAVAMPSGEVLDGFTWISGDGRDWTRLDDHQVIGRIAAGPSGIIGFPEEGWEAEGGAATWRLGD